jgi:hypothetical protein
MRATVFFSTLLLAISPLKASFAQSSSAPTEQPSDAPTATSLPATVVEEASAQSDRKVLNRVVPSYPSLAQHESEGHRPGGRRS